MNRRNLSSVTLFVLLLSLAAGWAGVRGQVRNNRPSASTERDVISPEFAIIARELLERPAPTPRLADPASFAEDVARPEKFFDPQRPPPDNAPLADLIAYWRKAVNLDGGIRPIPSSAVRERLLSAAEADPQILDDLLPLLPAGNDTADRVTRVYQLVKDEEGLPAVWRAQVERWLKFNSTLFLNDLIADAGQVKDQPGGVQNEDALAALAKLDPTTAKTLLLTLDRSDQPRVDAVATAWLFRIAAAEHDDPSQTRYLRRLRAIAADRIAPAKARDAAINGLLSAEWEGRDEWYLAQFSNENLVGLAEGDTAFSPLLAPLAQDPDKWILILTRMLGGYDLNARRNAGNCLVRFVASNPRRDAILPLLPWLKDRKWLKLDDAARTNFIFQLGHVDVPESIPGLGFVVALERENRRAAAFALKRYRDRRAVNFLWWALRDAHDDDDADRRAVIDALIACDGVSADAQFGAVVAYARVVVDWRRTRQSGDPDAKPPRLSDNEAIGKFLAHRSEVPDRLGAAILEEAEAVRSTDPALSSVLLELTRHWEIASVDIDLFRRIRAGAPDAEVTAAALKRRGRLTPAGIDALQSLIGVGSFASAVAAVLSGDSNQADHILSGQKSEPKIALLVCARLVQAPLPVGAVGKLLTSKINLLATAAEEYLVAEDSREARAQLWQIHPQQAYPTGWREYADSNHDPAFPSRDLIEGGFREEIQSPGDAPREVYALFDRDERPSRILRVYRDRAVYVRNETVARYRERTISPNELATFRKYVATRGLTLTGPQFTPCVHDCQTVEFLAMNRSGARRTIVRSAPPDLAGLLGQFDTLGVNARTRYRFENTIPGVEVLIDDPTQQVLDVWQAGSDLRVRIERAKTLDQAEEEVWERFAATMVGGSSNSVEQRTLLYKLSRITRSRRAWYSLRDGKLIPNAQRPLSIMSDDESDLDLDAGDFPREINPRVGLATAGPRTVLAIAESPTWGLWEKLGTQRPQLVSRAGPLRIPVISADGRWAVATRVLPKNGLPFKGTNQLVRLDLTTEEESPVELPLSNQIEALAYLPSRGSFLVRVTRGGLLVRADGSVDPSDGEPYRSDFFLVQPLTGFVQPVKGDFDLFLSLNRRMLQGTTDPNVYWAAIPDFKGVETQIGRYDVRDFSFHRTMTIPYVAFNSQGMWVDEAKGKLLIAYEGQLVRLPLGQPAPAAAPGK